MPKSMPAPSTTPKHSAATPVRHATQAEIQAAHASGKVWVNTSTGTYHRGGKWYGATRHGKFMTEDAANKAGYHHAKGEQ